MGYSKHPNGDFMPIAKTKRAGAKKASKQRTTETKIFRKLVANGPSSGVEAIRFIRKGCSAKVLKAASDFFHVPEARIQKIAHVPASTASRLEKKAANIDSAATERIFRMSTVARLATEIFGSEALAIEWLCKPNQALGEAAPLDLMDTEPGAVSVRLVLNAIATGGVA
jgi:putative toxin-antitoxin system antitoxin component (TIGR02293 family)